jgi:hypothetical protein
MTKKFVFLSVLYVILLFLFVNSLLKKQSTQLPAMKTVISHEHFNSVCFGAIERFIENYFRNQTSWKNQYPLKIFFYFFLYFIFQKHPELIYWNTFHKQTLFLWKTITEVSFFSFTLHLTISCDIILLLLAIFTFTWSGLSIINHSPELQKKWDFKMINLSLT